MKPEFVRPRASREGMFGSRAAFTLVELLVVLTIISILAAMLLPTLNRATETARASSCMSNQKQIGMAMLAYASDSDGWCLNLHMAYAKAGHYSIDTVWHKNLLRFGYLTEGVYRCPSDSICAGYWNAGVLRDSTRFSYAYSGYLGDFYWAYRSSPVSSCVPRKLGALTVPCKRPFTFDLTNAYASSGSHEPYAGCVETGTLPRIHARHQGGRKTTFDYAEEAVPYAPSEGMAVVGFADGHAAALAPPFTSPGAGNAYSLNPAYRLFSYVNNP